MIARIVNLDLYLLVKAAQLIGEGHTAVYYNAHNTIYSLGIGRVVGITATDSRAGQQL